MLEEVGKRHGGDPGAAFSCRQRGSGAAGKAGWAGMSINFSAGEEAPVSVLATTEGTLKWAAEELSRLIDSIRAGNLESAREVPRAVRDMNQALNALVIGTSNAEKLCQQVAGSVGTGTIDLHAARDEIGRRLARLRDAEPG